MYQHNFQKYPALDEHCIICSKIRTPENEKLECMRPETISPEFMRYLVEKV